MKFDNGLLKHDRYNVEHLWEILRCEKQFFMSFAKAVS